MTYDPPVGRTAKNVLKKQLVFLRIQKSKFSENKSEELRNVSSRVQSTTSNSLTVSSMQQSRMKSHRIGHQSSKRKPIRPTYTFK